MPVRQKNMSGYRMERTACIADGKHGHSEAVLLPNTANAVQPRRQALMRCNRKKEKELYNMTWQNTNRKKILFKPPAFPAIMTSVKWGLLSIAIIVPILLILQFAQNTFRAEIIADNQIAHKVLSSTPITEILSDIRDLHIVEALEKIEGLNSKPKSKIPAEITTYMVNFHDYVLYTFGYAETPVTAEYLMNHLTDIINYLQRYTNLDESSAYLLAEIIPYYIIQLELNIKNLTDVERYCNLYLKHLSEKSGVLSQEGAIIACLKIQTTYNLHKKANNILESLQEEITKLRETTFPKELGDNGKYSEQAAYLKRFYEHCSNMRNNGLVGKSWNNYWFDDKIPGFN